MADPPDDRPALTVAFSSAVYSLAAIKKAAYRLCDLVVVDVDANNGQILCSISPLNPDLDHSLQELAAAFRLEVLDQDLREHISAETAPLRNAILAHVFSKTGLQGE